MHYTRQEIEKYTGNPSQVVGIRELAYTEGRMRGARLWEVRAGNGLVFELFPDKCLDIGLLSYKGLNIAWQGKGGFYAAPYAQSVLGEFNHYFSGGMLWTCGLKNTGNDYVDGEGQFQHAHGRLGVSPCEQAWKRHGFEGDAYVIQAGGVVREAALGGHNLTLTRRITATTDKPEIDVWDTLENHEPEPTDYLILYHYNFGFPFIGPKLLIDFGKAASPIKPRSKAAEAGIQEWDKFEEPVDGYEEQCFFHDVMPSPGGLSEIKLENPVLGIGVRLAYDKSTLPILTQWKSLRSGEYVLGVEPGNSYLRGMEKERSEGQVGQIRAFGKVEFHTQLSFYEIE
jgi:hypothetical protein